MVRPGPGDCGIKLVRYRLFLRVGPGPFRAQPALGIPLRIGKPVGALVRELQREIIMNGDNDIAVGPGYFERLEVCDGVFVPRSDEEGPVRIGLADDWKRFLEINVPYVIRQLLFWLIEKFEQQEVWIRLVVLGNLLPKGANFSVWLLGSS